MPETSEEIAGRPRSLREKLVSRRTPRVSIQMAGDDAAGPAGVGLVNSPKPDAARWMRNRLAGLLPDLLRLALANAVVIGCVYALARLE